MTLLHAGLDKLDTISCANCTGFSSAAVRAIGSMHGLVELNLRGYMPLGSLQSLTALQTLTGTLQKLYSVTSHANRGFGRLCPHELGTVFCQST
jgi:hypothetical protein